MSPPSFLGLPEIRWDTSQEYRGTYYPEANLITIYPYMKKSLIFTAMLHEVGHWLLFRLGESDAVHTLNCAWDMLDYVLMNKNWRKN